MKVKITHTVDLDSVAERSKELIYPAVENIQKALSSLEALDFLLSGDEEESAQQTISLGPMFADSIPHKPSKKTIFFARATHFDPGPTILFTDLTFGVPFANAIIAEAPPRLYDSFIPNIDAA